MARIFITGQYVIVQYRNAFTDITVRLFVVLHFDGGLIGLNCFDHLFSPFALAPNSFAMPLRTSNAPTVLDSSFCHSRLSTSPRVQDAECAQCSCIASAMNIRRSFLV